ncbi:uncharacterized protein LOC116291476 [Actinia tenebrosa]|uniref:Uncharacterized protein LOC116291476 n=1 Tax=Actinia tenebrosa TaxID=6105 RepID=A0A6P8HFG1_ACTTE|nr:uncharacterized protein LOC116291476 [Actinia tenebrosa]
MVFSLIARGGNWLRTAWVTQPILFVSCAMGFAGPLIVYFSPLTASAIESMKTIPEHYPYPQLQETNGGALNNDEPVYPDSP